MPASPLAVRAPLAALAVAALVAAVGCGGNSKPAYCSDRSSLETAVKDLPSSITSGGVSGVQAQLTTVQDDAKKLVDSAKSDFPSETTALQTSVDALTASVKGLPSSPSATQIAGLAANASAVVNAVKGFTSATDSKCS